jgi:hypothetical protein
MSYRVEAAKPPTDAELAAARPDLGDSADLEAPPPPAQLRGFLAQAPASGWARADWVRKQLLATVTASGAGLPSQVPPDRVADMLYGSRLANPFQIVAAEALLERWAGIPARIGYGFDKGDPVGGGVLAVHPRHGAFWLEVNFKGLGWFPVTGAPLHALTTLGSKDVANTNQQVQPSDKIAVQIFIPVSVTTPALLYEQLRPLVAVAAAALLALALGYALWPIPFKAYRRWRRRSWARLTGRRAQIAVAYAEFRELAVDFGDANYADTPLTFLEHVVDDEEHTEFAWMVTRFLWGDLVGRATDDDVQAAWQLSRSLRKRIARMQPWSVRALAWASRLSVRHPYEAGLDYARNRREEDRDVA